MFQLLQEALLKTPADASVWVGQGEHPVEELGNFGDGGSIKGESNKNIISRQSFVGFKDFWNVVIHQTNKSQINLFYNKVKLYPGRTCFYVIWFNIQIHHRFYCIVLLMIVRCYCSKINKPQHLFCKLKMFTMVDYGAALNLNFSCWRCGTRSCSNRISRKSKVFEFANRMS